MAWAHAAAAGPPLGRELPVRGAYGDAIDNDGGSLESLAGVISGFILIYPDIVCIQYNILNF
jgi:hypothetical protein